jgi:hypothetical protein
MATNGNTTATSVAARAVRTVEWLGSQSELAVLAHVTGLDPPVRPPLVAMLRSQTSGARLVVSCLQDDVRATLLVSVNHGLRPNASQIRPTDDGDIAALAARSRVD